jgi:hypothetical protein
MVDGWVPVSSDSVNTLLWSNGLLGLQRAFRVRSALESIQSDRKFPATQGNGLQPLSADGISPSYLRSDCGGASF